MMKTAVPWWVSAGLFAIAGCADFTLVEPQPEEPLLAVHVDAVSDETTRYEVSAFFRRGTDDRGQPTELVDRALYVEGTPVLPGPETTPGILSYRWEQIRPTTSSRPDSVRVAFPVVASSPRTHSITIPVSSRDDPADISVTRGDELLLRVSPAGDATSELSGGVDFWILEIRQSCTGGGATAQFEIRGSGPFPAELRVPWRWLERLPITSIAACFRAFSSFQVVDSPYRANVSVTVRLMWRIQVVEPTI
jgi:hypothetical protein